MRDGVARIRTRGEKRMNENQKSFMYLLSYLYMLNGKWAKSMTLLEALHVFFPQDVKLRKAMACVALHMNEYEKTLRHTEFLIRETSVSRDQADGCFMKSRALWALDRREEARSLFDRFLALEKETS